MALVMYTTTGPVVCCDASHVGSLDTLHATDGLVDAIPGVSRCTIHVTLMLYISSYRVGTSYLWDAMHLVLDHWIHYTVQMM